MSFHHIFAVEFFEAFLALHLGVLVDSCDLRIVMLCHYGFYNCLVFPSNHHKFSIVSREDVMLIKIVRVSNFHGLSPVTAQCSTCMHLQLQQASLNSTELYQLSIYSKCHKPVHHCVSNPNTVSFMLFFDDERYPCSNSSQN